MRNASASAAARDSVLRVSCSSAVARRLAASNARASSARATTRSELRALLGFGARLRLCSRFQGGGFTGVRRCCGLRFGLVAQPYLMRGLGLHLRALAGFDCESGFRLNTLASERCGLLLN